uniref:non-ribosomal peptide synthetase n=1 Tax=Chitinolyticbacter albus TaxID=2961951 RepID=UPI00210CAE4D
PRDLSRAPVFQVMFTLQNTGLPEFVLPGVTVEMLPLQAASAKFELTLVMLPTADGYTGSWEFNRDLFDPATIERLMGAFETLLSAAVAEPDLPVDRLALLTRTERTQIVETWNDTATPFRTVLAHELFRETALRMPQGLAALDGAHSLSYEDLNRRSNQFARHLQRFAVQPHSLVGLCLQRSLDVAVAVLGVLKAGAACVPMDPAYPSDRLRFMAQDARAPVIVTHQALRHRVGDCDAHFICMDDCAAAWQEDDNDFTVPLSLEALCYVIYTSGSTGLPKGVALPHRMLSNLVQWQLTESALPLGARTLQFSPLSFDVSFDELFSTWAAGGALVMVGEETRRDPVQLLDLVLRERIARLFIPFVALQGIAEAASHLPALPDLREIVCGGEQLQITDEVVALYRKLADGLLHNQYGPTESHFVTGYRLSGEPGDWPRLPPIGKPMFNSQMYVLDRYFEPVPVGVRGDLYIAGVNLAQVYWQRPDLTAERFVPDPFGPAGSRMYRTGDVARYRPDGNIEFLGRSDHQVKIRGFRIELAEVEQALVTLEEVAAASATVREDARGLKKLFGYIVAKPGTSPQPRVLRECLLQKLPDYMVPSAIVILPTLPQTPSGKVDRKALPMPDQADLGIEYQAPGTPTEIALAAI